LLERRHHEVAGGWNPAWDGFAIRPTITLPSSVITPLPAI
jgi:hypothetical protein